MNYKIDDFLLKFEHGDEDYHNEAVLTYLAVLKHPFGENLIQLQIEDRFENPPNKNRYLFTFKMNDEMTKYRVMYIECNYEDIVTKSNDIRVTEQIFELYEEKIIDTLELFELIEYEK